MNLRSRIVLIVTAVCLAIAGGIVVWQPWGGALLLNCGGAGMGQSGVVPGSTVAFWLPLEDRGAGDEPITLRSATLTHGEGNGRFAGVRLRKDVPDLNPAIARWPDEEYELSDQSTEPLEGNRVPRGREIALYYKVEQTGPGVTRWHSATVTYKQGWRTYTATSDCRFHTDSKPMSG